MSLGDWWGCGGAGRENYAQHHTNSQRLIYQYILFAHFVPIFYVLLYFLYVFVCFVKAFYLFLPKQ
jgi:hypothetical protein